MSSFIRPMNDVQYVQIVTTFLLIYKDQIRVEVSSS